MTAYYTLSVVTTAGQTFEYTRSKIEEVYYGISEFISKFQHDEEFREEYFELESGTCLHIINTPAIYMEYVDVDGNIIDVDVKEINLQVVSRDTHSIVMPVNEMAEEDDDG